MDASTIIEAREVCKVKILGMYRDGKAPLALITVSIHWGFSIRDTDLAVAE